MRVCVRACVVCACVCVCVCVWPILVWLIASTVVFISSQTRTLKLCIHIHIHAYMVGSLVSRQVEYSFAIGIYLYTEHASSHNAYLWRIGFWLHFVFLLFVRVVAGLYASFVRRTHAAQVTGRTRSECMGYIERAKTAFALSVNFSFHVRYGINARHCRGSLPACCDFFCLFSLTYIYMQGLFCFICCVCMCVCIFYRPANLDLTEPRRRIAW